LSTTLSVRDYQITVQTATLCVLGDSAVATDKSFFGPSLEILGFLISMQSAAIRPKDIALDKIFYCFFRVELNLPLPVDVWQCLASLASFYAPDLRGMTSFVAPLHHMVALCGKPSCRYKRRATANAAFCVIVWRAVSVLFLSNRDALSVPLDLFVNPSPLRPVFDVVSDASPWRIAAAVYLPGSNEVIAWSTILLPFSTGGENKYQLHREYLGYLFSLLLLLAYSRPSASAFVPYRWINDNMGALAWSQKHRCSSSSSVVACFATSQLHLLYPLFLLDSCHLPGSQMGEIDAMSRRERHSDLASVCPSLSSSLYIPLENDIVLSLFRLCDPASPPLSLLDFQSTYSSVLSLLQSALSSVLPSPVLP
jgi:hypothetical protein